MSVLLENKCSPLLELYGVRFMEWSESLKIEPPSKHIEKVSTVIFLLLQMGIILVLQLMTKLTRKLKQLTIVSGIKANQLLQADSLILLQTERKYEVIIKQKSTNHIIVRLKSTKAIRKAFDLTLQASKVITARYTNENAARAAL